MENSNVSHLKSLGVILLQLFIKHLFGSNMNTCCAEQLVQELPAKLE
jgi:hypothetical protein